MFGHRSALQTRANCYYSYVIRCHVRARLAHDLGKFLFIRLSPEIHNDGDSVVEYRRTALLATLERFVVLLAQPLPLFEPVGQFLGRRVE